jgi:hypothetical protein
MSRKVPSFMNYVLTSLDQNPVDSLIQLTLDQAKSRGQKISDLEGYHHDLGKNYRDFEDSLQKAIASSDPSLYASSTPLLGSWEIETPFRMLVWLVYLLGSSSPEPSKGIKRIRKAMEARKKGWEEPVEKAIAGAFAAASPNLPEDKDIIKMVHDEMDRLGIKLTAGDEALRKRIRPHRKDAERAAKFAAEHPGAEMDADIPF